MSRPLLIFVSHSPQDDAFARELVSALREAGADVWSDEQHRESDQIDPDIARELRARLVFVAVLSPAALASRSVEEECKRAYSLWCHDPIRIILPVLADKDALWPFLQEFKRVEASGLQPYPLAEAVRQTLLALALTPRGEGPAPISPQPTESAADLVTRGKALRDPDQRADALLLFERATQLDPNSFDAWMTTVVMLTRLGRASEAEAAFARAKALGT
jgi:tetratricopeptide (TPR) repeat protein